MTNHPKPAGAPCTQCGEWCREHFAAIGNQWWCKCGAAGVLIEEANEPAMVSVTIGSPIWVDVDEVAGTIRFEPMTQGYLRTHEIQADPMPVSEWTQISQIFDLTEGGAYGFALSDPEPANNTPPGLLCVAAIGERWGMGRLA